MPQPLSFEAPELQSNESFKSFTDQDSLGKAYLELDGKFKSGSLDILPEEMRKDPSLSVFKSVSDLAKGFVETKKMVGAIEKAPGKPEEYKFTALENLHPGIKSENITKSLAGVLHANGVGNKAADGIQQGILTALSQAAAQQDAVRKETATKNETALRGEWGAEYDKNFDLVHRTLLKAAGKESQTAVEETAALAQALKGAPVLLKSLNNIFSKLSEDAIGQLGDSGGDKPITDKAKAQERINEIIAIKPSPILDEKHVDHVKLKKEWDDLHKVLSN